MDVYMILKEEVKVHFKLVFNLVNIENPLSSRY